MVFVVFLSPGSHRYSPDRQRGWAKLFSASDGASRRELGRGQGDDSFLSTAVAFCLYVFFRWAETSSEMVPMYSFPAKDGDTPILVKRAPGEKRSSAELDERLASFVEAFFV